MGLAIDGNEVHGIARGGQAFVSLGNVNTDGSLNIGGQDYFSTNKMKIIDTGSFGLGMSNYAPSVTVDVTSNLSNYGGYLAICELITSDGSNPDVISQPISIPTTSTTDNLSFYDAFWSGSLSRDTSNNFTLDISYSDPAHYVTGGSGNFYIISNEAS